MRLASRDFAYATITETKPVREGIDLPLGRV